MSVQVVALGDSTSCGEGVGLSVPLHRTWPALLAAAVPGAALLPLATAGARVRDVRAVQLGPALDAEPHLATLLIGLNDVSRGGFDAVDVAADLTSVVRALRRTGATVLLGRLHDPTRHLPLPAQLGQAVRERVAAVNAAVDRAYDEGAGTVHLLDLERVPGLRLRQAWAVDRLHPSEGAHVLVAGAAAAVLRDAELPVGTPDPGRLPRRAPGRMRTTWWAARHGAPWLVGHTREVLLPALSAGR